MERETIEAAAKNAYKKHSVRDEEFSLDEQIQRSGGFTVGFKKGTKWQVDRMSSEIEQKWLEYRNITNNEDAWCFKEWLVNEFKKS